MDGEVGQCTAASTFGALEVEKSSTEFFVVIPDEFRCVDPIPTKHNSVRDDGQAISYPVTTSFRVAAALKASFEKLRDSACIVRDSIPNCTKGLAKIHNARNRRWIVSRRRSRQTERK